MPLTKQERQARERSMPRCWCGNTIGLHAQQMGSSLCSKHAEAEEVTNTFDNHLADLRQKGRELGCNSSDLEVAIDLIADMMELLQNK